MESIEEESEHMLEKKEKKATKKEARNKTDLFVQTKARLTTMVK
jgi:hypothetical protein